MAPCARVRPSMWVFLEEGLGDPGVRGPGAQCWDQVQGARTPYALPASRCACAASQRRHSGRCILQAKATGSCEPRARGALLRACVPFPSSPQCPGGGGESGGSKHRTWLVFVWAGGAPRKWARARGGGGRTIGFSRTLE